MIGPENNLPALQGAKAPLSHPKRLAALAQTGLVPGQPPTANETLDRLTSLVAKVLRVPLALVSLVEENRQAFVGMHGELPAPFSQRETPISHSFCQHVVRTGQPLVIHDSLLDERVQGHPAIRDLGIAAYLGVPLRNGVGHVLGSLCAIDTVARTWTTQEMEALDGLAGFATAELEVQRGGSKVGSIREQGDRASHEDFEEQLQLLVHDLRTPLQSLLLGLQTLPLLGEHNEDQRDALELAMRGGQALVALVDDILDLGASEAAPGGRMVLDLETMDPCRALEAASYQVKAMARARHIDLRLQWPAEGQPVLGLEADWDKLVRTLINLLGNAIKFTPDGGSVNASVQGREDGESVEFAVRDTGRGIAPEDFERIFERFVRVGGAGHRSSGRSSGLGLSFCKMVATAHGGSIEVESEPGIGSLFTLRLPCVARRSQQE